MAEELDKLRKLINESDIPTQEQNDLLVFLPILPKSAIEKLYELFNKEPKLMKSFNEDFQSRLDILIDGRDKWQKLIDREEEMLNDQGEEDPYGDYDEDVDDFDKF